MQIITSIWSTGFSATSGGNVTGKNSLENNLAFANECAITTGIYMDEFQKDNFE